MADQRPVVVDIGRVQDSTYVYALSTAMYSSSANDRSCLRQRRARLVVEDPQLGRVVEKVDPADLSSLDRQTRPHPEVVEQQGDHGVHRQQHEPLIGPYQHRVHHRQRDHDKQVGHLPRGHGAGAVAQHREDGKQPKNPPPR